MKATISCMAAALLALAASGCATTDPMHSPITDEKRVFTYDYDVPGASKTALFKAARNFLATDYKNSKSISRVEDEADGTLIGKAGLTWYLHIPVLGMTQSIPCGSNYNLIFVAKDNKARLQLELIEGATLPATCGWKLPTKGAYPQVVDEFNGVAKALERSLNGKSSIDGLKNF